MGLDIYIVRGDAWPAYDRMIAHHHRLWDVWQRRGRDYRVFSVFSNAIDRFHGRHIFDCPAEWADRPGGNGDPGYIARGSLVYGTDLHDKYLRIIFDFWGCDFTPQN